MSPPQKPEISPLFKSDGVTKLTFEPKDGKIYVAYHNWEQNKAVLEGQAFVLSLGPQGLEGRIIDKPRGVASPQGG